MGKRYFDFSNFFPQLPENDETNGQKKSNRVNLSKSSYSNLVF